MRLVVIASGRGSNLQAIMDHIASGQLKAEILAVISDKENAFALERARKANIPGIFINPKDYANRNDFDTAMAELVSSYQPDYVVMAGYMRILTPAFVERFPMNILNIHPALLPSFPGLHAQRQAVDYGVKVSGCTVHFVDNGLDSGPIIGQSTVPVFASDDEESLAQRILEQEHQLYSKVLMLLAEGRVAVEGRKVVIK